MKRNKEDNIKYKKFERLLKGAANHRRVEILFLLEKNPGLSVEKIAEEKEVAFVTIASHLQKLSLSGLVNKKYVGRQVLHELTPYGKNIITFLRML